MINYIKSSAGAIHELPLPMILAIAYLMERI
jgi:hypothetical protein